MLLLHDRASMERALTLDLDPQLLVILKARIAALDTPDGDLTDCTEFLIVQPGDTEADIVREIGFSPLVEPIDKFRFGSASFNPFWDRLVCHWGWFEMVITFGGDFALFVLIQDEAGLPEGLLMMCREFSDSL